MKSIIAVSFVTLVVWTNLQGALPGTQPGVSAEITFTSGLDEQNNPIDDLAEISLEKDGIDIYIYSRWEGIPDGQHQYAYKLFGNTGQLVLTHPFDFTSTTGSYRIWSERKFRRTAVDKTGDWRVEVLLDGQKVAERTLRVLDRWGRRYSPTRPMLEDAQVEQLLVEAHDLMKRGLYEDTVKVFKQANRQSGGDCEDCLLGLAQAFNKMGAFKNAAKEARRAVEASTYLANRIRAYSELGFALLSAEDNKESLGEAEQAFTKILELSEGDSNMARFNLAHVLLRLKRETEARALLREFIDYDPESATADRARAILKNPRRASEPAAPDFSMVTLDGEYLTSEDLQGKVVLLDFWATWCGPCKAALPALRRLSKKMEKDPFVLISLSSEDESVIRAFVEANRMNWLQYRDERGQFSQNLFPSRTLPTYVLIDHEGIIVFRSTGWSSSKERALTSRVSKAIKTARKAQPPRREQEQHNRPVEASSKDSLPDLDEQSGRTDQGKKTQTLPGRVNVSELALDSTNPSTLYAGTDDIGVSKSTDRGAHWTPINNGLTNARKEIRRSGSDDRETPKRSPRSRKRRVVPPLKTLHVFDIKLERPPYTSEQAHSPRIAFVSMRNGKADLYSINPDGTGLTNLTRHPSSDAYPSWSPDGSRIAFRRGFDFYVMKADGSDQRMVVKNRGDNPEFDLTSHWSPDSSKLVFASSVTGFPHLDRGIFVVGPDGLTFLNSRVRQGYHPSWSNDGSKILFESSQREQGRGIYVMNLDGRNLMKLAAGTGMRPVWSPDGSKIAFGLMEGGFHIYSINPDGSELQNLTADSGGILPSWSPDGSQIAFKTFAGELWVMNADGSNKRRLADQLMLNMHQLEPPSWSPDGTSICFTRGGVPFEDAFRGGSANYDIYVVRVDGSNLTRLTTNPALDHDPVWSPRGGHEQLAPPAPPIPLLLTPSPMPPKHFFRPNEIPLEDGRGSIRIGDKDIALALKDQDSATMVLYVDRDGDGDPLNDTGIPTQTHVRFSDYFKELRRHVRWSDVELGGEGLRFSLGRNWASGPFPDSISITPDFAWRVPIHIDGKRMQILVLDEDADGIPSSESARRTAFSPGDRWALRLEGDDSLLRQEEVRRLDAPWVETDRILHVHIDKGGQVTPKLVYSSFDQSPDSISGSEATTVELSLIPIGGPRVPSNLAKPKVVTVTNNQAGLEIAGTEIRLGIKRDRPHSPWNLFVDKNGDGDPYNDRLIRSSRWSTSQAQWSNVDLLGEGQLYHLTAGWPEKQDQQEEPVPERIEIRPDFFWGATLVIKGDEIEILVIDADADGIPSPGDVWQIRRFQDRWKLIRDELLKLSEALIEGGKKLRLEPLGPSSVQVHFDPQLQ